MPVRQYVMPSGTLSSSGEVCYSPWRTVAVLLGVGLKPIGSIKYTKKFGLYRNFQHAKRQYQYSYMGRSKSAANELAFLAIYMYEKYTFVMIPLSFCIISNPSS